MGNTSTKDTLQRFWDNCIATFRMNGGILLWANGNPTQAFSGTATLYQSIANFKYFVILWQANTYSDNIKEIECVKYLVSTVPIPFRYSITTPDDVFYRSGSVATNTTVAFDDAKTNGTTDNNRCIPFAIYGTNDLNYLGNNGVDEVKINNSSIVTGSVANFYTQSTYNASSNKIATMNDVTKANVGLSNVTNDKQVKATSATVTSNNIALWDGTTGALLKDSGKSITTSAPDSNSTDNQIPTAKAVWTAIDNLPEPMVFKGSLGSGGTISDLPAASSSNEGFVYKVITAGTYASQSAKIGDTFISTGSTWVLIPSGDEPSGTVTSVNASVPTGLTVSGVPITTSGTITIDYASGYSIPTTTKQGQWDAKYDKPSTGIPKTDLESGVQTSLGLADSALQPSTITGLVKNDGSIDTTTYVPTSTLSNYIAKSSTTGLVKNDGSIDTTAYITINDIPINDITVTGSGNAITSATLSSKTITFTKGTTFLTSHQSIKSLKTDNTSSITPSASEALNGAGTINLHKISKTGDYTDLLNTPTIPTVNNSTITIKKNSSDTGDSFTTNTSSSKTINLGLATVATSGSYNDLSNTPSLATVATSGSYNDLTNKPTIPTVPITEIQVNSSTITPSSGVVNITVPTSSDYVDLTSAQTITGTKTFTSPITLYSASGDSPMWIFQRGTLTDNYNDWGIIDSAGLLYFKQRGQGSTDWSDIRVIMAQQYVDLKGEIRENGTALASKYVRCDTNAQGLTDTKKQNARTNIGAGEPVIIRRFI